MSSANNLFLTVLIVCLALTGANGQQNRADSLLRMLEVSPADTSRVKILTKLGNYYTPVNIDSAVLYTGEALALAYELDYNRGKGEIYAVLGDIEVIKDKLFEAREKYLMAIKYKEEANLRDELASLYLVLGNIYLTQDNYVEALNHYLQGVTIAEELNQLRILQFLYNNLGLTYKNLADLNKALDYYEKSLEVTRQLDSKENMPSLYVNIGLIHSARDEFELARSFYVKAMRLNKELGDKAGEAIALNSLGALEYLLGNDAKAEEHYTAALRASEQIETSYLGPRSTITAATYSQLGKVSYRKGLPDTAIKHWKTGLELAEQSGQIGIMKDNCEQLSRVYEDLGKPGLALEYYKRFKTYSDSIVNEEVVKRITTIELQFAFDKEMKERELQQTKKEAAQKRKELTYIMIILGVLLSLVIILLFFFLQRNKVKRIQLSKENLELEKDHFPDGHLI